MDAKKYVLRLLEDLEHVTSSEEREAFDSSWLRGYVAGVSIAAQIALELERGEGAQSSFARRENGERPSPGPGIDA